MLTETKNRVRRLAASGEGEHIEYKRKVDDPTKIVKELIAFANGNGGTLLVGISDDGSIPGLSNPAGDWFILEKAIKKYCKPLFPITAEIVDISSKKGVIVIDIEQSSNRPHYFQEEVGKRKEVYIRNKDECVRASKELADLMHFAHRRIFIKFGEEEKQLLEYLKENDRISVLEFKEWLKIPRRKASRILVKLTAADVLKIIPGYGREDKFILKE